MDTLVQIQDSINNNEWKHAELLLNGFLDNHKVEAYTGLIAILETSICIHNRSYERALICIQKGLEYEIGNYELYFMQGNIKELTNNDAQAMISYENALFYCNTDDKGYIEDYLNNFKKNHTGLPGQAAIIIVSYNNLSYTQLCIDSIRHFSLDASREIIVIDNNSEDGTREWLELQSDIKYISNKENKGFPAACNQGIALAEPNSDIFLLNNDTVVMTNSIYCLRMALYKQDPIGAVGAVSNRVGNNQQIEEEFETVDDYMNYCNRNNVHSTERHELRVRLIGFAVLFKRSALNQVGLLDEAFGLGHYEDDDISVRMLEAAYKLILCKDSFIYHFGNRSFCKNKEEDLEKHQAGILKNKNYFVKKWGVELSYYSHIREDILQLIDEKPNSEIKVLEIGCGCGATLLKLSSTYPRAEVHGVELIESAAKIGGEIIDISVGNIEEEILDFGTEYFDYIILGDVLEHLHDSARILCYLKQFLKMDGHFIISIPNLLNHSVMIPLLRGNFAYEDAGILDRTHLRFFTKTEIIKLFISCGFHIEELYGKENYINDESLEFVQRLCMLDSEIEEGNFLVYQYLLKVQKNNQV